MKAISARITKGLNLGAWVNVADNSGAKIVKIVSVVHGKGTKSRQQLTGVGDHVKVSVKKGIPEMKKQVFDAVVVRQRKSYRRLTGERICFEDNAVVITKDKKGEPKGTQIKGPIAREAADRWPFIAKIAPIAV
jgi:large subunit ribosomal protein L14